MSGNAKGRPLTKPEQWERGLQVVRINLEWRMKAKGRRIFVSSHEVLGVLAEEMGELTRAIEEKSVPAVKRRADVRQELIDVAVGALFGIISIDSGKMDWI